MISQYINLRRNIIQSSLLILTNQVYYYQLIILNFLIHQMTERLRPFLSQDNISPLLEHQAQLDSKNRALICSRRSILPFLFLFTFLSLIVVSSSTQMQIISQPTIQDIKRINFIKSLRRIRQRHINLANLPYVCVTGVRQKPISLENENTGKKKLISLLTNGNLTSKNHLDQTVFPSLLQILDDDIFLRHKTKQFIYGYKHKKIVSQFDDQYTKHVNQKPEFENFTMGLFTKPEKMNIQNEKRTQPPPIQRTYETDYLIEQKNNKNDRYKDYSKNDDELPLSKLYAHGGKKNFFINSERNIIESNIPLGITKKGGLEPFNISLECTMIENNQAYYHYIVGLALNNFQLIVRNQISEQCKQIVRIEKILKYAELPSNTVYFLDKVILGNLEKSCILPTDQSLRQGDYILIQTQRDISVIENNKQQKMNSFDEIFLLRIEKIIGQNVYQSNTKLPWTVKIKKCSKIEFPNSRRIDYSGQIYLNRFKNLQFNEIIQNRNKEKLIQVEYNGGHLMKNSQGYQLEPGTQLFCLLQFTFSGFPQSKIVRQVDLTVISTFGDSYIEVFPWDANMDEALLNGQIIQWKGKYANCIEYRIDNSDQIIRQKTNIFKMSKSMNTRKKFISDSLELGNLKNNTQFINQDSVLYISLQQDTVLELITTVDETSKEQQLSQTPSELLQTPVENQKKTEAWKNIKTNKYLLTHQKIYKIQSVIINGTKIRLQKTENQFYENSTNQNSIIIHKGIWRAGDFLKFPRYLFSHNQKLSSISVKFGVAYLRIFDFRHYNREDFYVSSTLLENHEGYGPKKRPEKSLQTSYSFQWGTFCGGSINKNRETKVKISCGQSWYKLNYVKQISPCSYEILVTTQFLCEKNIVFPALKEGFKTFEGSICIPERDYEKAI